MGERTPPWLLAPSSRRARAVLFLCFLLVFCLLTFQFHVLVQAHREQEGENEREYILHDILNH